MTQESVETLNDVFDDEEGIDELLAALSDDFPTADESSNRGAENAADASSNEFDTGKEFDDSHSKNYDHEILHSGANSNRSDQFLAVDRMPVCPYLATKSMEELNEEHAQLLSRIRMIEAELMRRKPKPKPTVCDRKPKPNQPVQSVVKNAALEKKKVLAAEPVPSSSQKLKDAPIDFCKPSADSQLTDDFRFYKSDVHCGDTSSSEDEQNRDPGGEKRFLSDEGRLMKRRISKCNNSDEMGLLRKRAQPAASKSVLNPSSVRQPTSSFNTVASPSARPTNVASSARPTNVEYYDADFKIRVLNPKLSSVVFSEYCQDKRKIQLNELYPDFPCPEQWVTMGVVVEKYPVKVTCKGSNFVIWRISDLINIQKSIKLFLFGECFEQHWKLSIGTVFALLNPTFMEPLKDKAADTAIKIDHPQKLREIGVSPDLGYCKGMKKGSKNPCTQFINKSVTEYCDFHVMSAAKKFASKRGALQSGTSFMPKTALERKLLGPNGTTYGGKNYTAKIQPKVTLEQVKSALALEQQTGVDSELSNGLGPNLGLVKMLKYDTAGARNVKKMVAAANSQQETPAEKAATSSPALSRKPLTFAEFFVKQRTDFTGTEGEKSDAVITSGSVNSSGSLNTSGSVNRSGSVNTSGSGSITMSLAEIKAAKAKRRAAETLHKKGISIEKVDPNEVPGKRQNSINANGQSSQIIQPDCSTSGQAQSNPGVPQKFGQIDVNSSEFLSLLTAKTNHESELDQLDRQRESVYFDHLEKREQIEQRMTEIRELKNCKVVTCQKCNYTARKQSEICAAQKHPVVWHRATKRFFKCKDCKKRQECYEKYPVAPCVCGSTHFERVSMRDERNGPALHELKIDEEPKPYPT